MDEQAPVGIILDAHVHLPAYSDPGAVVESAKMRGIKLTSVTVSASEAARNFRLREEAPSTVRCFIGIHPSEAVAEHGDLGNLEPLWEAADGVGEVGLDPKYSSISPGSDQLDLFKAQVEVAERLKKPIQVHSRGAEERCLDVLEGYTLRSLLMHWFEGEDAVARVLSAGRFVSFGPAILYSKKLVRIAKRCPPEMVLAESDGPVAFAPLGGAEGPGLTPSVAFKLAEVWGKSFDEAVLQLSLNERAFFR
jgi:TatD DNase family protein